MFLYKLNPFCCVSAAFSADAWWPEGMVLMGILEPLPPVFHGQAAFAQQCCRIHQAPPGLP